MRRLLTLGLLLLGLAVVSTPALIAGTAGQDITTASDGNDYDTGGG